VYVDLSDSALKEVCSESDRSTLVAPRTARLVIAKGAQLNDGPIKLWRGAPTIRG
jgi:hypothetical protein